MKSSTSGNKWGIAIHEESKGRYDNYHIEC